MGNLASKPHNHVTKDLKGKYVLLYGSPKSGKTSMAVQFPKNLLLAVEQGYNALDDIAVADVPDWKAFLKYVKELESDEEDKAAFDTITIDTISLLYDRCVDYICDREDVNELGEIGQNNGGYKMVTRELERALSRLIMAGYGLVLICHEKREVDKNSGTIKVTLDMSQSVAKMINKLVDATVYLGTENGKRYLYPRNTTITQNGVVTQVEAGSRFAELNDKIECNYESFAAAMTDAMEKDAKNKGYKLTDEPVKAEVAEGAKVDFKNVKKSIATIAKAFKELDDSMEDPYLMDYYKGVVRDYLGSGRGVKDATEIQADQLALILDDLKDYIKQNKLDIAVD